MLESLNVQEIERALAVGIRSGRPAPLKVGSEVVILDKTGSTNDDIAQRAADGAGEGLAIFAERQTAGRGRKATDWVAPPKRNLTFSVLLRPTTPVIEWPRFAHAAGLAVLWGAKPWAEGQQLQLKWPNDVVCGGRKLAGILLETRSFRGEAYVILGIGLNVNSAPDDFPPDISAEVCSLRSLSGQVADRNAVAGSILAELNRAYDSALNGFDELLPEITRRSSLLGKQIRFHHAGSWRTAEATGFGPNGELRVREDGEDAEQLILSADHVRLT